MGQNLLRESFGTCIAGGGFCGLRPVYLVSLCPVLTTVIELQYQAISSAGEPKPNMAKPVDKFRHFLREHLKDVIIVALFTVTVFAIGKLFNSCVFPPPVPTQPPFLDKS